MLEREGAILKVPSSFFKMNKHSAYCHSDFLVGEKPAIVHDGPANRTEN